MAEIIGNQLFVRQQAELPELFGIETRNKYQVLDESGQNLFFVAEQQKGLWGILLRQVAGHWREFSLHFYDERREKVFEAWHPFAFWFQKLMLYDRHGQLIGSLQQRWSLLRRRFDVLDSRGVCLMEVRTSIFSLTAWGFPFFKGPFEVARVDKKFSGIFVELYTDKDNFLVSFNEPSLSQQERQLVLAAAIFIDLTYFEVKN
jgi:uncharacterized protein YxjI